MSRPENTAAIVQQSGVPLLVIRTEVQGRFIFSGEQKFYVRSVTYGLFGAARSGCEYHDSRSVQRDFAHMASLGINAVRTYTVPPRWLLDK